VVFNLVVIAAPERLPEILADAPLLSEEGFKDLDIMVDETCDLIVQFLMHILHHPNGYTLAQLADLVAEQDRVMAETEVADWEDFLGQMNISIKEINLLSLILGYGRADEREKIWLRRIIPAEYYTARTNRDRIRDLALGLAQTQTPAFLPPWKAHRPSQAPQVCRPLHALAKTSRPSGGLVARWTLVPSLRIILPNIPRLQKGMLKELKWPDYHFETLSRRASGT
jgi:hypothetical protein